MGGAGGGGGSCRTVTDPARRPATRPDRGADCARRDWGRRDSVKHARVAATTAPCATLNIVRVRERRTINLSGSVRENLRGRHRSVARA